MAKITIEYYSEDFRIIMMKKLDDVIDVCGKHQIEPKVTIDYGVKLE